MHKDSTTGKGVNVNRLGGMAENGVNRLENIDKDGASRSGSLEGMALRADLEALHGELVQTLREKLQSGVFSASELNVIRYLLKDNGIVLRFDAEEHEALFHDLPVFSDDYGDET